MQLITAYQQRGHLKADLDPLKLGETYPEFDNLKKSLKLEARENAKDIDYKSYGFTTADLEKEFYIDSPQSGGFLSMKKNWKLKDIISSYEKAYCGKIGIEYAHIQNQQAVNWIRDRFERLSMEDFTHEEKERQYDRLMHAHGF